MSENDYIEIVARLLLSTYASTKDGGNLGVLMRAGVQHVTDPGAVSSFPNLQTLVARLEQEQIDLRSALLDEVLSTSGTGRIPMIPKGTIYE